MCSTRQRTDVLSRWNWDGDFIVHECIVPSSRPVAGSRSKKGYDIDVREFLISEKNEVIQRTIKRELQNWVKGLPWGRWEYFLSRDQGSFDYRASVISGFVSELVAYVAKPGDAWLFPDETLSVGAGDCEDRALLTASLMLAAGISPFNVRVVLGKLRLHPITPGQSEFDHVWVMYKNEAGEWTLVEPVPIEERLQAIRAPIKKKDRTRRTVEPRLEYVPLFLFNDHHLWSIEHPENNESFADFVDREWRTLDPRFIGEVHKSILEEALGTISPAVTRTLTRAFHRPVLNLFGPIVDDIDREKYDPIQHFDNGYIDQGWRFVAARLEEFRSANEQNLPSFAHAAHAIADFYAHSSYAHFAEHVQIQARSCVALYDTAKALGGLAQPPTYAKGSTFDLTSDRFTVNSFYWGKRTKADAAALWNGKIISGRYAQQNDTQPGLVNNLFMEGVTYIPKNLLAEPDFWRRGGLPHHNEIAVDESLFDASHHKLYAKSDYARQFELRKNSAVMHVRAAFLANLRS